MAAPDPSAFWNTNLPSSLHTVHCPSYLRYALADPKDRATLATRDADYQPLTWAQVRAIVAENRLQDFSRVPSELRRYREYTARLEREYGSVMRFIVQERLRWAVPEEGGKEGGGVVATAEAKGSEGEMFEVDEDYLILPNDWPYGLSPSIAHLVVWTKFSLPSDPHPGERAGDLTADARAKIQSFVTSTFGPACADPAEDVLWFRNWSALKSIQAVEHFHVLLRDPDEEVVRRLTRGEVAMVERV